VKRLSDHPSWACPHLHNQWETKLVVDLPDLILAGVDAANTKT
jgi:hypothetical protein